MLTRMMPVVALLACGASMGVTAEDVSMVVGSSQTFTATVLDQFGNPMASQPTVAWSATVSSSAPAVVPAPTSPLQPARPAARSPRPVPA